MHIRTLVDQLQYTCVWRLWWFNYPGLHAELESACLSELNENRLCIALLDRLLCVV